MIYLHGPSHIYGDELGCRGPGVTSTTPAPCYADDCIYANMGISQAESSSGSRCRFILSLYSPCSFLHCIATYLACCAHEKSTASSHSSSISHLHTFPRFPISTFATFAFTASASVMLYWIITYCPLTLLLYVRDLALKCQEELNEIHLLHFPKSWQGNKALVCLSVRLLSAQSNKPNSQIKRTNLKSWHIFFGQEWVGPDSKSSLT